MEEKKLYLTKYQQIFQQITKMYAVLTRDEFNDDFPSHLYKEFKDRNEGLIAISKKRYRRNSKMVRSKSNY